MDVADTVAGLTQLTVAEQCSQKRDSLRAVFVKTADGLYRFILVRLHGDRDAADDILQQTCCEASKHRHPPADEQECEAWLRGIARNLIRRHWRGSKRLRGQVAIDDVAWAGRLADDLESRPLPVDAMIREETIETMLVAVTALSASDQHLIFSHYFEGCPQGAIAEQMGVTQKSIESRLLRARGRLRQALREVERSGER